MELTRRPMDESILTKARQALEEGMDMIANLQKLIRITNHSELNWSVIVEYEADDLPSNSEDEERPEKAEKAVNEKIATKDVSYTDCFCFSFGHRGLYERSVDGVQQS